MNKFPIGSQWKTHGGWRAVIVDYDGERPIVWHSKDNSIRDIDSTGYDYDGYGIGPGIITGTDFIPTPWEGPVVHEGWINVHKLYTEMHFYNRRENADIGKDEGDSKRIACIPIKFTEGEGL